MTMTINAIMTTMKWAKSDKWQNRHFRAKKKGEYDNDDKRDNDDDEMGNIR